MILRASGQFQALRVGGQDADQARTQGGHQGTDLG
jgi:hypothetical protein